jgi:hypothetical protein
VLNTNEGLIVMAKCYGCSKEKGARHTAACTVRPGRLTVRDVDCQIPKEMQTSANLTSLTIHVHSEGVNAMQEQITDLLGPVMAAAEERYHATHPGVDLFKDLNRVLTPDEEEYIQLVLERCAGWLKDDMPTTLEGLRNFGKPKRSEESSAHAPN